MSISEKFCKKCKETKPVSDFSIYKNHRIYSYCKKCEKEDNHINQAKFQTRNKARSAQISRIRKYKVKECGVKYLGGRCVQCGYNEYLCSLDFHHKDPSKKDFEISGKSNFNNKLKKELDKCVLLCKNCHQVLHYKERNPFGNPISEPKIELNKTPELQIVKELKNVS